MSIILQAGLFAKLIILILLLLSLFSWAIIFQKIRFFGKIKRENRRFFSYYRQRRSIKDTKDACDIFSRSPLSKIAFVGITEWESFRFLNPNPEATTLEVKKGKDWVLESILLTVKDKMARAIREEEREWGRYISFLATTTAVSPFLGLLGTVWGITHAFINIRGLPMINLTVIAPGISDALITTIAGLLVAIPALVGYNYIISLIRNALSELEDFSQELVNDFRRQVLIGS